MKMKTYIGTKIIEAVPSILMAGATTKGGYRVRYPDGSESWIPKALFEKAYRPIDGMNFGLAIEAMKRGKKCRRAGWNGKNQHIELASAISYTSPEGVIVNAEHDAIGNKAIAFCGTSGIQMGWLASQADMLADDWEIVE